MTDEKLTEEERAALAARYVSCGPKALRIIDRDAAALARVRALCEGAKRGDYAAYEVYDGCLKALAGASEDIRWEGLESELAAANARAEAVERDLLEARSNFTGSQQQLKAEEARRIRAESERDEWKGKCEAAERDAKENAQGWASQQRRADRAESEAAQWKAKCERIPAARSTSAPPRGW